MFKSMKARIMFEECFKRKNINTSYQMVSATNPWYETMKMVEESSLELAKLNYEEKTVKAADGILLKGHYYAKKEALGTVVLLHSYGANPKREWARQALFYLDNNWNVFIPFERAHGISMGKYYSMGIMEANDILCFLNEYSEDFKYPVLLHGISIGANIALNLANRFMPNVLGIIAEAPFYSLESNMKLMCEYLYKREGMGVYQKLNERYQRCFGHSIEEGNASRFVRDSKYPILYFASKEDNSCKATYIKRLYEQTPLAFYKEYEQGSHGQVYYKNSEDYQETVLSFIKRAVEE